MQTVFIIKDNILVDSLLVFLHFDFYFPLWELTSVNYLKNIEKIFFSDSIFILSVH